MGIESWLIERNHLAHLKVENIPVESIEEWFFYQPYLKHSSGRYFSVVGLSEIDTKTGQEIQSQPIIKQTEIGILGFLFCRTNESIRILLQAKTEPGNVNGTQVGPSVQATYSNYMQVHKGKATTFIEYFTKNNMPINSGTLQSEQGTRFLGKYNQNIAVFIPNEEEAHGNLKWFDLQEVLNALELNFIINTDARSVLVCMEWDKLGINGEAFSKNKNGFGQLLYESLNTGSSFNSTSHLIEVLDNKRASIDSTIKEVDITLFKEWFDQQESSPHPFYIRGVSVNVKGREVEHWQQPIFASYHEGLVILFCKKIKGVLHFLVGLSKEIGFMEKVQFGPSVMIQDNINSIHDLEFDTIPSKLISEYKQSDEGGRFFQSITTYQIREIDEHWEHKISEEHVWMTLSQIKELLPTKGNFNNEFRSVLSLILKYV